jgi:hypothetical protein
MFSAASNDFLSLLSKDRTIMWKYLEVMPWMATNSWKATVQSDI